MGVSGAGEPLRELHVGCVGCGWSVNLKASADNPENYDITTLDGWEIGSEQARCASGARHIVLGEIANTSAWPANEMAREALGD